MPAQSEQKPTIAPAYVDLSTAGAYTSLCERTLRRAIANGELTGYRLTGKSLRVKLSELDAWAESRAMPNARTAGTRRR